MKAVAAALDQGVREGEGRPLAEVFALTINNIDNENPGDLYGTVKVTDALMSQYIYNRVRENSESIRPGENALLTGPDVQAISASDSFTIEVALMDKDADLSPDDPISHGHIAWNVNSPTNNYDVPISKKINGQYGSATVVYAVLGNAVQATVQVTLIDADGENPAEVFGLLTATNSKFSGDFESVLFKRNSAAYASVGPGQLIPLSRSIVAVPLDSNLIVGADLLDYDFLSANDEIAKGTANFPARLSGTSQLNISGKYGQIQVKVTWTAK